MIGRLNTFTRDIRDPKMIEDHGVAVHSIDEVASGKRLVEEAETLQERT